MNADQLQSSASTSPVSRRIIMYLMHLYGPAALRQGMAAEASLGVVLAERAGLWVCINGWS